MDRKNEIGRTEKRGKYKETCLEIERKYLRAFWTMIENSPFVTLECTNSFYLVCLLKTNMFWRKCKLINIWSWLEFCFCLLRELLFSKGADRFAWDTSTIHSFHERDQKFGLINWPGLCWSDFYEWSWKNWADKARICFGESGS